MLDYAALALSLFRPRKSPRSANDRVASPPTAPAQSLNNGAATFHITLFCFGGTRPECRGEFVHRQVLLIRLQRAGTKAPLADDGLGILNPIWSLIGLVFL